MSREALAEHAPTAAAPSRGVLRRLVVGTDGSPESDAAAAFAARLAEASGAETTLVHVRPTTPHASPAGELIDLAARTGADLVLAGTGGVGRLRGRLLGSVSSQLLAHAPCSVMLFPSAPAPDARSVLVALDGSPDAAHGLRLGAALAVALGARLVLAHVADDTLPFAARPPHGVRDELLRHGRQLLHEARETVAAPLDEIDELVLEGGVREELVSACERERAAVLVTGSRGLGGFDALSLGGTPRWVVNHATCPVLVARRPAVV